MANILRFPTERVAASTHRPDVLKAHSVALIADTKHDAWLDADTAEGVSLDMVANLAAVPSQSLVALVTKVEMLVARLVPEDGTDAGLCVAEVSLLGSVLRDLRALASDVIVGAQKTDLRPSVLADR